METQTLVVKGSEWSHGMEHGVLYDGNKEFCILGLLGRHRGIDPSLMWGRDGFEAKDDWDEFDLSDEEIKDYNKLTDLALLDPTLSSLIVGDYPEVATGIARSISSINDCSDDQDDNPDEIIEALRPEFAKLGVELDYRPNE